MVKIYFSYFHQDHFTTWLSQHINLFAVDIQKKALRYHNQKDSVAFLYGRLLLKYGLQEFGLEDDEIDINYTEYGRPYLMGINIDFNISHSCNYVVCAISDECKIGIDIEKVKSIDIRRFKTLFLDEEWSQITKSSNRELEFYRYWTIKESIVKALGKGLNFPFKKISLENNELVIEDTPWFIRKIDIEPSYMSYLATNISLNCDIPIEYRKF